MVDARATISHRRATGGPPAVQSDPPSLTSRPNTPSAMATPAHTSTSEKTGMSALLSLLGVGMMKVV